MGRWRVLPLTRSPAAAQLAASEALLQAAAGEDGGRALRWYTYSSPAVVLGVGQAAGLVRAAAAVAAGVEVVQRRSGGAAVYADGSLLALDVVVPDTHPGAGPDVLEAYRWVGEIFYAALGAPLSGPPRGAAGLHLVTVAAARADRDAQRAAPQDTAAARRGLACFGTLSPYEVALQGEDGAPARKLVGLSQVRRRGVVLYQAGLYTAVDPERLTMLLTLPDGGRAALATELGRRMAGADQVGLAPGDLGRLREAVTERLVRT